MLRGEEVREPSQNNVIILFRGPWSTEGPLEGSEAKNTPFFYPPLANPVQFFGLQMPSEVVPSIVWQLLFSPSIFRGSCPCLVELGQYMLILGHCSTVMVGTWFYWVSRRFVCLYIVKGLYAIIWFSLTDRLWKIELLKSWEVRVDLL